MCGIAGVYSYRNEINSNWNKVEDAIWQLNKRGPNNSGIENLGKVVLGHSRLSIIDLSLLGNQPMSDKTGVFKIVFNGEIYNYKKLKSELEKLGCSFKSNSDSEVLLNAFIVWGKSCLEKLEGCFAFSIYNQSTHELFIARDRFGINPLYWYKDEERIVFASELKAMLQFPIRRELNNEATQLFFELNYIPAPLSIIQDIHKLMPGECISVSPNNFEIEKYYSIPRDDNGISEINAAKRQARSILEKSVSKRLVADVPVGTYLSGGIDSTIISLLAKQQKSDIKTFSIGYKDNPFFDESPYALEMAKHIGTDHHSFMLNNDDFLNHFEDIMDYMDEPFADSSAIPVYILSKETAKQATVVLSGDGADEIFGGYNKHKALVKSQENSLVNGLFKLANPILQKMNGDRNSSFGNKIRQVKRYANGVSKSAADRYWSWASISNEKEVQQLLKNNILESEFKCNFLKKIESNATLSDFLKADMNLVLPNDMLTKVDMMSMANSLEVRVPFLDKDVVEFGFSLNENLKINNNSSKHILRETFKSELPDNFFTRKKQGFEIPLESWFQNELKTTILNKLNFGKLKDQNLLNTETVKNWIASVINPSANNLGHINDAPSKLWALLCFQIFVDKYID